MRCEKPAGAGVDVSKDDPHDAFAAAMEQCRAQGASWPGAVAVSGGSDSMALLHLLADWAKSHSLPPPIVLTVDHGLSAGSSRAAHAVTKHAKRLGLAAHKLVWKGAKPVADIEAGARAARYALMGVWCAKHGVDALYVAHTLEDQAETFLLRLARGSGLDGLAAMRPHSPYPLAGYDRLCVVRPLLGFGRDKLRAYLQLRAIAWTDDPMNVDPRFARVRLRQAAPVLAGLGLSPQRIAAAAGHLARARDALKDATVQFLDEACRYRGDRIVLDGSRFATVAPEIGLRALAHLLSSVSGETYRPRFERLERLFALLRAGELKSARTLHGCRIGPAPKAAATFGATSLLITREAGRTKRVRKPGIAARDQIS